MKEVTSYFRNAVAAATQGKIELKNENLFEISEEEIIEGKLCDANRDKLLKSSKTEEESESANIIIVLKTILDDFKDGVSKESVSGGFEGIFFMPVNINGDGEFCVSSDGKLPWIPREYLTPMEESVLALGSAERYDEFLTKTSVERGKIDNWRDWFEYAKRVYRDVTKNDFDSPYVLCGNEELKTDDKFYAVRDFTVNASKAILSLYNDILKDNENALYSKITSGEKEKSETLRANDDLDSMLRHCGQMNGVYPLSQSQREALHHFNLTKEGDVMAVSGPPGTGKTTLLQSIVADMYVNRALKKEDAPVIVATSTNNQAVTNIIDSFGNISKTGIGNIESRWIDGVNSFAVYFPFYRRI